MTRKAAAAIKPKVIIKNDGKKWTFVMQSSLKTTEISCEEDVEFDEETADGRKSKTLVKTEGPNKVIQEQKDPKTGKVVTTIVRELVGDKFHQVNIFRKMHCYYFLKKRVLLYLLKYFDVDYAKQAFTYDDEFLF